MIGKKTEAKTIKVKGIAIRPGISRNGILYTSEELDKFAPTLEGKPILKDHKSETDNTIGLVERSESVNGVVAYEGWIKEDGSGITEKIEDRRIKEVSMGAMVKRLVKENDDDDHYKAIGIEAMELSTTPTPGVRGTSLSKALESINKGKKILPILENVGDFKEYTHKPIKVDDLKEEKEVKMTEEVDKNKLKEDVRKELVEEMKLEKQKISDIREKAVIEAKAQLLKEQEDEKKDGEEIAKKEEEFKAKLTEELKISVRKEIEEEMKKDIKEKNPSFKGKINEEKTDKKDLQEEQDNVSGDYVVENCGFGEGMSIFKQPKADGSLR